METMRVRLESLRVRGLSSTSDHRMLIKPIRVIKRLWDSWKRPWVLSENDYRKQSIHLFIFNFLPLVVLKSCGEGWPRHWYAL